MQSWFYSERNGIAKFFALLLLITFGWVPVQAQNITLLSRTNPVTGSISFGDVWGEGNIACMGVWLNYAPRQYGVGIFDITDPTAPVRLSTYFYTNSPNDNQFEQGVVRNQIGY